MNKARVIRLLNTRPALMIWVVSASLFSLTTACEQASVKPAQPSFNASVSRQGRSTPTNFSFTSIQQPNPDTTTLESARAGRSTPTNF